MAHPAKACRPLIHSTRLGGLVAAVLSVSGLAGAHADVDFERDIRPILKDRCVECHGPSKQKGALRLDAKSLALRGGENGPVFVAGSAAQSPLFQRVVSADSEQKMPPKGAPLTSEQVDRLKQWLDTGANWPEGDDPLEVQSDPRLKHWAVQPVRKEFPKEAGIDFFVAKNLASKGLALSSAADKRTLLRRLYIDLTGLPPSMEQVAAFVSDPSPDAYAKQVDSLLGSPRYGERWALHWLDIAHYADTHGFERDQLRPNAWRYRDYVIQSLNDDKPYDQFLREQIAGDVLAPAKPESVIATGFLAAGPWDFVGQVETKSDVLRRAARAGDLDDLVTQVITASMGVTINCARCHDHKLDPISQREYYQLRSVFAGVKRADRPINAAEVQRYESEKATLTSTIQSLRSQIQVLSGKGLDLADIVGGGDGSGNGVKNNGIHPGTGAVVKSNLGFHKDLAPNTPQKPKWEGGKAPDFIRAVFVPNGEKPFPAGPSLPQLEGLPKTSGHAWDAIRNGPLAAQRNTKIGDIDYTESAHSLLGLHANSGITFDLTKIRATSGDVARFTAMLGFGASPEASKTRAGLSVFLDNERKFERLLLTKDETSLIEIEIPASAKTLTLVATDGGDGIGSDLLFLGDARLLPKPKQESGSATEQNALKELQSQLKSLEGKRSALVEPAKVYGIQTEAAPPSVRIQKRGNPEEELEAVQPGAFLWAAHSAPNFGDDSTPEGERRKALAEWIVHSENPLTRRVIVNRLWHHHFGQGLVTTPSDFGLGGDRPSHPELLDWLADQLLLHKWSLKQIHRLIVTSATYCQQSTTVDPRAEELDAQNRLLWRQNPRRLDAESFRDAVLAASGKLNLQVGGPGFRDFKYTEAYAPIYEYTTQNSPDVWRRSVYRFVVRTTPHSFLTTLDCPDPANLTPVRAQTTTALQALTLSNSSFMIQQARHLAERIQGEIPAQGQKPQLEVERAFAICLQRPPSQEETAASLKLCETKGLFALCRMLLNANEFIYID